MLVGVCDFPGDYAFPPPGYGGIDRWLWAATVGARAAGAEVHLLGRSGDRNWPTSGRYGRFRLEDMTPDSWRARNLRDTGYDLLVVGHEYPSLPAWRAVWEPLAADVATFQHWPYFEHQADAFDGASTTGKTVGLPPGPPSVDQRSEPGGRGTGVVIDTGCGSHPVLVGKRRLQRGSDEIGSLIVRAGPVSPLTAEDIRPASDSL